MKEIRDLFGNYRLMTHKSRRTERGDFITTFTERLNGERGEYKPLTIKRVAVFLSPYPTQELHFFLDKCNKSKNFSKCFWYFVKPK